MSGHLNLTRYLHVTITFRWMSWKLKSCLKYKLSRTSTLKQSESTVFHCTVGKLIHRVIVHFNSTKYNLTTAPCLNWNDRQPLSTLCHCHCHLNKSEWQLAWPNKYLPVLIQCVFIAMSQTPQTNMMTVSPWGHRSQQQNYFFSNICFNFRPRPGIYTHQ